jgi:hypothetical protein
MSGSTTTATVNQAVGRQHQHRSPPAVGRQHQPSSPPAVGRQQQSSPAVGRQQKRSSQAVGRQQQSSQAVGRQQSLAVGRQSRRQTWQTKPSADMADNYTFIFLFVLYIKWPSQ